MLLVPRNSDEGSLQAVLDFDDWCLPRVITNKLKQGDVRDTIEMDFWLVMCKQTNFRAVLEA